MASSAPPAEKLNLAIENHLMRFEHRFTDSKITLRDDYFAENDAVMAVMGPIWDDYERLWLRLIRDGQKRGQFDPSLDPRLTYYGILGMCNWVARWYEPNGPVSVRDLVEQYTTMVNGGIHSQRG